MTKHKSRPPYAEIDPDELNTRLTEAIFLFTKDLPAATTLLFPYVPINGPQAIDYGIYSLQYMLSFGDELIQSKSGATGVAIQVNKLLNRLTENYPDDYYELLAWTKKHIKSATEQIKRAKSSIGTAQVLYKLLSEVAATTPERSQALVAALSSENGTHLIANAYKDLFENDFFLVVIANLILISDNVRFSETPLLTASIDGSAVTSGTFIKKGLALKYLISLADQNTKKIIEAAYDSKMRNLLGGHNDYFYDPNKSSYISGDRRCEYSLDYVALSYLNLEKLYTALRLDLATRLYEEYTENTHVGKFGYVCWGYIENKKTIQIMQYWANFRVRKHSGSFPKEVIFYVPPAQPDHAKHVAIGLDKKLPLPLDLAFDVTDRIASSLELLYTTKGLNLQILSVAPKVHPFTEMSNADLLIADVPFVILDSQEGSITVEGKALTEVLEYINSDTQ